MEDIEEFVSDFYEEIMEGIVDILIIQTNNIGDFQFETPVVPPLVASVLSTVPQSDSSWQHLISYVIKKVPKYAIVIIRDIIMDISCPTVEAINRVFSEHNELTRARAARQHCDHQKERNICVVLACLAERFAGTQSSQIFTPDVCDYLFEFLLANRQWKLVLYAFLALEKFAVTSENKEIIAARISQIVPNPLIGMVQLLDSNDSVQRQIGFCARWALDNTFQIPNRRPSYETVDMSRINCILRQNNEMFTKLSPDGLEVRCDTGTFGTVLATCEVGQGTWYYEVTSTTSGPVRIGLVTTATVVEDNYALGQDSTSIGFDGCTRLFWSQGASRYLFGIDPWSAGKVLGFYVNTIAKKVTLVHSEGTISVSLSDFFDDSNGTKKFIPAVTIVAYEQFRFNFGADPFVYGVPDDGPYSTFNEVGHLTPEEKIVMPRNIFQIENSVFNQNPDACEVCFDNTANVRLTPCGHDTFCSRCMSILETCPICRVTIAERVVFAEPV